MSAEAIKRCPVCGETLQAGHKNGLTTWQCPSAHGVGINLVEAYGHLQRDELEAIWSGAHEAPSSPLRSPISGKPMVEVTFAVDGDATFEDGADARPVTIEVDVDNYFGWFSFEELRSMPGDTVRRRALGSVVGLAPVERTADEYDEVFDNLEPLDLVEEEEEPTGAERSPSRLVRGLARRLRS